MKKNNILYKIFKWNLLEFLKAITGVAIFSFAVNTFIVPNHLYNGGVLGTSQLLGNLVLKYININFNIIGLINFCINVPLFILAYRHISKTFFSRTLICVIIQTLCLTFIPIPKTMLVDELVTSVLIGGVLAGIGCGLVLTSNACMGGTDIIGIALSSKNRNLSVGKIGIFINVIIFSICGILYGTRIMIYSILYSVFSSIVVDKLHLQNISSNVLIFTKKKPDKIIDFVNHDIERDVTMWEAIGTGTESKSYISYVVLSKYELARLERHMPELDNEAFIVKDDNVSVYGNFPKKLTK